MALLARLLAHYIAFSVTGKAKVATTQLAIYNQMIGSLPVINANEGIGRKPREAEWVRARDS